ncbi:hypothetical protein ABH941_007219 [Streptacidiphilus sp. EB103A]
MRTSLPYACRTVTTPPPSEAARGQLLRALASDGIRGSLERRFGVRLAFMNCRVPRLLTPRASGFWSRFGNGFHP